MSVCCAICCDVFKSEDSVRMEPVVLLKCHHVFHRQCLLMCIPSRKCPLCRMEFSNSDIKFNKLHLTYSPSSLVIANLVKEIEDLKRGNNDARKKLLDENKELKALLADTEKKFKAEKRKFQLFKDEILLSASRIVRYCRNINLPALNHQQ